MTTKDEIASDLLDYLRENPDACAQVSVRVGRHPWVRWDSGNYVIVEQSDIGNLQAESCPKEGLLNLFAENPVELYPASDATYSPPEPGEANVWKSIEEGAEHVRYVDPEVSPNA